MECCIICGKAKGKTANEKLVSEPSIESVEKLLSRARERDDFKDHTVADFVQRTQNVTAQGLIDKHCQYHRTCYQNFTNVEKLNRARKRFSTSVETGDPSASKRKAGRPSLVNVEKEDEGVQTRSKAEPYDKTKCIICQTSTSEKLHQVMFHSTGANMLSVSKQMDDKSFFRRMNSIFCAEDGVANDVMYHLMCWAKCKRKAETNTKPFDDSIRTISDIELLNFVRLNVKPAGQTMNMNEVNSVYKKILLENGECTEVASTDKKKYLKSLISENIEEITFVPDQNPSKPEQLFVDLTVKDSFSVDDVTTTRDVKSMLKLAKEIRKEILNENWNFNGDFSSYKGSPKLYIFLKWILFGPLALDSKKDTHEIERVLKITSQFISQNVKTNRQTNYHLQNQSQNFSSTIETPLNVGTGIAFYHSTRSKKLVNFLSDLNVSANYKKVIDMKSDIAQSVLQRCIKLDGIFIPRNIVEDLPC